MQTMEEASYPHAKAATAVMALTVLYWAFAIAGAALMVRRTTAGVGVYAGLAGLVCLSWLYAELRGRRAYTPRIIFYYRVVMISLVTGFVGGAVVAYESPSLAFDNAVVAQVFFAFLNVLLFVYVADDIGILLDYRRDVAGLARASVPAFVPASVSASWE